MTKVLIGGVPYGTNNIGDEAILAGIVGQLRRMREGLDITVITTSPEKTAEKLNVRGVPLSWDEKTKQPLWDDKVKAAHHNTDVYIHGGATGLHDYPVYMCTGLRTSQRLGKKTVIYGTGGGPYRHRFYDGRKTRLLGRASKITLGLVDFRRIAEGIMTGTIRAEIVRRLRAADLILLRDDETRKTMMGYGLPGDILHVVGDAATTVEPAKGEGATRIARENGLESISRPLVAVCIASQKIVKDLEAVSKVCDHIVENHGADIVFFPMNPFTDTEVGVRIRSGMSKKDSAHVLKETYYEPEEVMAFLPGLSLIISSRLHLIILGAVTGVPSVGIGRGSGKVKTFLGKFGIEPAGDYDTVNYESLETRVDDIWSRRDELKPVILAAIKKDQDRFREVSGKIKDVFDALDT
ncbi:MAG: polysaccharide pyruvyl transferase family protein [Planctomycetota bacterium]